MSVGDQLKNIFTPIADAIRRKRGTTSTIPATKLAEELDKIITSEDSIPIIKSIIDGTTIDTNIVVPDNVTTIKDYCFHNNQSNILIHQNITNIGKYAFEKSGYNGELNLPNLTSIGEYAFNESKITGIKSLNITSLPNYCFQNCYEMQEIIIPNGVTSIGNYCFKSSNTYTKTTKIVIPEGVTTLGLSCFNSVLKSGELYLPKTITSYGISCFSNCYGSLYFSYTLDEYINKSVSPSWITEFSSIYLKDSNGEYYMPKEVTFDSDIKSNALIFLYSIEKITLTNNVTSIGQTSLYGNKVSVLSVPSSVTTINSSAFSNLGSSTNKVSFVMESTTPPTLGTNAFNTSNINKIYVPKNSGDLYKSGTNWSTYASYIVEPNTINYNVSSQMLNNENYQYSIDNGTSWNQFTTTSLTLTDQNVILFKNSDTTLKMNIGTTSGGSEVASISGGSELTYTTSENLTLYFTLA